MGDATRPIDDAAGELAAARSELSALVGELTHAVLELFRTRGFAVSERITHAGGDPLEAVDVFVVTLRSLADGLADPISHWPTN